MILIIHYERDVPMKILIKKAILHILDKKNGKMLFSEEELDIDSEICEDFITNHIKKIIKSSAAKKAHFNNGSKVQGMLREFYENNMPFVDFSLEICKHMYSTAYDEMPASDIMIIIAKIDSEMCVGVLKLDHKALYTHKIVTKGQKMDTQLMQYESILPSNRDKVSEACIISCKDQIITLIDMANKISDDSVSYFSEIFLECNPDISKKEIVQGIEYTLENVRGRLSDIISDEARLKLMIMEQAEEEGFINLADVANEFFDEDKELACDCIEIAKEVNVDKELYLGEKLARQKFGVHKLKFNDGIQLTFPTDLIKYSDIFNFVRNQDGSISICMNNLRLVGD